MCKIAKSGKLQIANLQLCQGVLKIKHTGVSNKTILKRGEKKVCSFFLAA
jgi:hypothetical protein